MTVALVDSNFCTPKTGVKDGPKPRRPASPPLVENDAVPSGVGTPVDDRLYWKTLSPLRSAVTYRYDPSGESAIRCAMSPASYVARSVSAPVSWLIR